MLSSISPELPRISSNHIFDYLSYQEEDSMHELYQPVCFMILQGFSRHSSGLNLTKASRYPDASCSGFSLTGLHTYTWTAHLPHDEEEEEVAPSIFSSFTWRGKITVVAFTHKGGSLCKEKYKPFIKIYISKLIMVMMMMMMMMMMKMTMMIIQWW